MRFPQYLKSLVIVFLIVLVLLIIFHNQVFGVLHLASDKFADKTGISLGKTAYDFESAINIFRPKKDIWSGDLPILQFELSQNDLDHFNELSQKSVSQGYLDEEINTWRNVKLKYKGETYDAEISLHGDNKIHWTYNIISYKVKLSENHTINNLRKFSLIMIEDRILDGKLVNVLSEEFGSFEIRDDFVAVKINGVSQGLYYMIERLDQTFLENNKCSSCEVIKLRDTQFRNHPLKEKRINPALDPSKPYGL